MIGGRCGSGWYKEAGLNTVQLMGGVDVMGEGGMASKQMIK